MLFQYNYYSESSGFVSKVPSSTGSSLGHGVAVSLTADGTLQAGAGTSIYKNVVDLTTKCPSYLSLIPVLSNTYLLSYADKDASTSTLQVITVDEDAPNTGTVQSETPSNYFIYELATLSTTDGTFVGVCQDLSVDDESAFVISGKVDAGTYVITLVSSAEPYVALYSVDPVITRLSSDSFAIAYYSYINGTELETRFGEAKLVQWLFDNYGCLAMMVSFGRCIESLNYVYFPYHILCDFEPILCANMILFNL